MSNGHRGDTNDSRKIVLERLPSLQRSSFILLDGGFATHLEDALGQDISSSPLWSASLLDSEQGSKAIVQTHLDFLKAGANVISTSSYQASALAFRLAGISEDKAEKLLIKSVQLAQQARQEFNLLNESQGEAKRPLLSLSLGPYGAALSNGSEYTGDYFIPDAEQANKAGTPVTTQDLEDFHYTRLYTIASSVVWTDIDMIAFETIPRLEEAVAIRTALDILFTAFPRKLSYASFVFPQGLHLPWPAKPDKGKGEDMKKLLEAVLGNDEQGRASSLNGVGINCTKPKYLSALVGQMTTSLAQVQIHTKPYLFLYPDGGLVWDGTKRVWTGEKGNDSSSLSWSEQVLQAGRASQGNDSRWAGCFIGGCCKATTEDIGALRGKLARQ